MGSVLGHVATLIGRVCYRNNPHGRVGCAPPHPNEERAFDTANLAQRNSQIMIGKATGIGVLFSDASPGVVN
jgi:hypothetical protein